MKILFICTHNRCRSILAEAIARHFGEGLIQALSAGSQPADTVHPLTLAHLEKHGVPTAGLHSKSWHDCEYFEPDVVITVCDDAAGEACPLWFGKAAVIHWGLPDPSRIAGDPAARPDAIEAAFNNTIGLLKYRILTLRGWLAAGRTLVDMEHDLRKMGAVHGNF
ncbi:MAG: arsenate reductase ArsC [Pseudomonadales bacterium]|nr:arsenate reductase ArsC [Pseudomonadales bacterium]